MSKLRGFWKPPVSEVAAMKADRAATAYKIRRKKPKKQKHKAPWVPVKPKDGHAPVEESFYKSLKWRQLRYLALRNTDGRCQCCGGSAADGLRIHVDHVHPRKTHPHLALSLDNLQVLCEDCNCGKGSWDSTDWRAKMG